MSLQVQRQVLEGPAGDIELMLDLPDAPAQGLALVGHPHPLYGGTMENKVAATVARAFAALGWVAARPNFRGVGASAGVHDHGAGETQDFLWLADALPRQPVCAARLAEGAPLALCGFSFGSFVAASAARELVARGRPPRHLVLVGTAAGKWPMPDVDPDALLIHGELDETIALSAVFAWARPQGIPVVVLPGADHFFHRRLTAIKRLIARHVLGATQLAAAPTNGGRDE